MRTEGLGVKWTRMESARRLGSVLVSTLLFFSVVPAVSGSLPTASVLSSHLDVLQLQPGNLVTTPFGLVPSARVFSVPSGSVIVGGTSVVLPNGTQISLPTRPASITPTDDGWLAYADWTYTASGYSIGSYDASWTLPSSPTSSNGQTIFLFNGLESSSSGTFIIQPVLQWGSSACGGGPYWEMAAWYVTSSSYVCSTLMNVSYSAISGQMSGSNCQSSNGECDWVITGTQFQNGVGYSTTLSYSGQSQLDDLALYWSSVTLEAYNIAKCSDFPSGSVTFSDLSFVSDVSPWQYPTPVWNTTAVNFDDCGEAVTVNSPTSVTLTF